MSVDELNEVSTPYLAPDVVEELAQEQFANCKHGRSAYRQGCRGPVCRRAEALHKRELSAAKAERENREYRPSLRRKRDDSRGPELDAVLVWQEKIAEARAISSEAATKLRARQKRLISSIESKPTLAKLDKLLEVQAQLAS